ncbi:class I SAM-dependent methyltransferase [Pseudonocardia sichuanensis]|uniref:Ubiquinone/menaquinone biosynthesis C-methylase UbiE n=1 Tax=Pseudonocardia kunmingensis TaxID=630975 RepID=A0A543D9V7_9PSEU|nr:class I SAM-dependent methyltransferase [Pseudonocardia kunmingensis]TQM06112.1 ubiquinone/menaquinone biosynthesis C-methylase UbiE [Pseudonocardia kunmingensis]
MPADARADLDEVALSGLAAEAAADAVDPPPMEQTTAARRDLDRVALAAMASTLRAALVGSGPTAARRSAEEVADRLGAAPRHRWLVRRWLAALASEGLLDRNPAGAYARLRPVPDAPSLADACAGLGYPAELARFFAAANEQLPRLVRDEVLVQELLFPDGGFTTAETAYRRNLVNRYLNAAVRTVLQHTAARPLRVLELGAGVGGTTVDVVPALNGTDVDYLFTDVSTFFLTAARERFAGHPWMRFALLDMNAEPSRGGLADGTAYDVILAANVLHNAHHVGDVLRRLHGAVTDGGLLVFIESCREHHQLLTSMHFLMSPRPGQPAAGERDRRAGEDRIFLTAAEWRTELRAAGLRPLFTLPPPDHPLSVLEQQLFVARRDPPATGPR